MEPRRICYINITTDIPPRDIPYVRGMRALGIDVFEITRSDRGVRKYFQLWKAAREHSASCDFFWIGYSGHPLPLIVRLATQKMIVFNALSSLYEGVIISRGRRNIHTLWGALPWLIDAIGFRCVDKVLVETNAQAEYCTRLFRLPRSRCIRTWTGADEDIFHPDSSVQKLPSFTALFRGAFLPESGIMVLAEVANILRREDIQFRVIGDGMLADAFSQYLVENHLTNIEWIRNQLPRDELRTKMLECHISLGQLSDHTRLQRTIPHKAFESIALGLPYVTARTPAIMELLREGETCIAFSGGDAKNIAYIINELHHNRSHLEQIGHAGHAVFTNSLTDVHIVRDLLHCL